MRSIVTSQSAAKAAPATPPKAPAAQPAATAPSGSWTIVPGLLVINWAFNSAKNEVDVSVSVLWWTIDSLTGTLNQDEFSLKDSVSILGEINGSLELSAVFGGGDPHGLWVTGDLEVFGNDWSLKERLISW